MRALVAAALTSLVFGSAVAPRPQSIAWGHGNEIAFSVGGRGIFVVDPATRHVRRLTAVGRGADAGAWSPDGETLAFGDGARLYTIRSDGSTLRSLGRGFFPAWSRDGRRLAYVLCSAGYVTPPCEHDYGFDVYTIGADARHRRRASARSGNPQCVDWSRSGLLAWQDGGHVTIAGPHRRRTLRLNGCPVWSPDGRTLAVASGPFGPILVSASGRVLRRLHVLGHRTFALGQVAWSPDGRELAYLGDGHLYLIGADGRGARKLL